VNRLLCIAAICGLAACSGQTEGNGSAEVKSEPAALENAPADTPPTPLAASTASTIVDAVDCAASEETIFSCKTSGGKRIAVCATGSGKVEYRFGSKQPELVLSGGRWAAAAYSGGGEAQIAFDNGATRYVVFSRMVRTNFEADEPNYPAISDGVLVLRKDKVVATLTCADADPMPVQYDAAEKHMKQQDELVTYETERADPIKAE